MNSNATTFDPDQLQEHVHWMRALARELVGDEHAAEDLVQDTWTAAIRSEPDTSRPLRPWLGRVLRDFFRLRARGDGRRRAREIAAPVSENELAPDQLLDRAEAHALLVEEVQQLAEPFRETVLLRYFEGLSAVEIAKLREVPEGTVRWRLKRGLDALRERLDARYDGERIGWCQAISPIASLKLGSPQTIGATTGASTANSPSSFLVKALLMTTASKLAIVFVPLALLALGFSYWSEIGFLVMSVEEQQTVAQYRPIAEEEQEVQPAVAKAPATSRSPIEPVEGELAPSPSSEDIASPTAQAVVNARLIDSNGQPIQGLELHARNGSARASAFSSADGEVALELPAPQYSPNWQFEVRGAGYATVQQSAHAPVDATTYLGDVTLEPGGALSGFVREADGTPIANATVVALDAELHPITWQRRHQWINGQSFIHEKQYAQTNAQGEFQLSGLPIGELRLGTRAEAMATVLSSKIDVRANEEGFGLEIIVSPLEKNQRIEGIVLSSEGNPMPYHAIRVNSGYASEHKRADTEGRFCLAVRAGDEIQLSASSQVEPNSEAFLAGLHGGDLEVVLQFSKGTLTEVRVMNLAKEPIERFALLLEGLQEDYRIPERVEEFHQAGRMQVALPNRPCTVSVTAPGFAEGKIEWSGIASDAGGLEFRLEPVSPVTGTVTANGEEIEGAQIVLIRDTKEGAITDGFPTRFQSFMNDDQAVSNSNGEFLLTARVLGSFYVLAEADGYALAEFGPLTLGPETGRSDLDISLVRGGSIVGVVTGASQSSPTGSIVGISRGDGHARSLRVGPDGSFRFEQLTPGPWQVQLIDEEIGQNGSGTWSGKAHAKIPFNCTVNNGEETWIALEADAELDTSKLPVLRGALTINGEAPVGWIAQLLATEDFGANEGEAVQLDSNGHFEIAATSVGRKRLILRSRSLFIFDVVDLSIGENPWAVNIKTGSLSGSVSAAYLRPESGQLFQRRRGPNELICISPIEPNLEGSFSCPTVAGGQGEVIQILPDSKGFELAQPLKDVLITVGSNTGLDL